MHNINKFPIIIVSSPRTGSTILAEYISKKYNLKLFSEPDENKDITQEFYSYIKTKNNSFVLKFHARNFSFYENLDIFANSYLISIQRKNIVEQIASHYVARARNKFIYNKENVEHNEIMDVNLFDIVVNCEKVYVANKALREVKLNFDKKVFFEDLNLQELGHNSKFMITPKPKNYDYIIEKIAKYINCEHIKNFV